MDGKEQLMPLLHGQIINNEQARSNRQTEFN